MRLGVCYYPEHWPEAWWADDARAMVAMGLSRVRIGEFAWSRIEPERGRFEWDWLDRAIDTLGAAGLGIVLGTPTATPPQWLVEAMPDVLARDAQGQPRRFGSRRHYCFAHLGYRAEAARIVTALAARYGTHPAVVAWETDNEYGCHDTALSWSDAARDGFRIWLAARYADIDVLNAAWGNVFWSQEYRRFEAIDLPNLTVTEPNPAHVLDFRRFSSEQVIAFNRAQTAILRAASPGRDLTHNFMGFFTQFDHHAAAKDLDVAGWDSYPLGFLEQFWFSDDDKLRYARQGHPDIAAFHHDLYRGMARGRWWVTEQQPGSVNWAAWNPAPLPGMVRLWTLEAMAHGAELVSYFRWRQAPFGQEAMHTGLHRPDRSEDVAADEVRAAAADIAALGPIVTRQAPVALVFDYEAAWVCDTQPQGRDFRWLELVFDFYSALRRHGVDVDIVAPDAALDGYRAIVIPCLPIVDEALVDRLVAFAGPVLIGPRSGSKTCDFATPATLAPGPLQRLIPIRVVRVESLRPGLADVRWRETVVGDASCASDARGNVWRAGRIRYVASWLDGEAMRAVVGELLADAGIATVATGPDVRVRCAGVLTFAFNYGPDRVDVSAMVDRGAQMVLGGRCLDPAGVAVWRTPAGD